MTIDGLPGGLFKWEGPLDARKIVERTIAGMIASMFAGFFMGVGFYAVSALLG